MVLVFFTIKIFNMDTTNNCNSKPSKNLHKAHIKMFIYRMNNEAIIWVFSTSITNWILSTALKSSMHKTALKNEEKKSFTYGLNNSFLRPFPGGYMLNFQKNAKSLYPTIHIQHMYVVTFANSL